MTRSFTAACVTVNAGTELDANLETAGRLVREARDQGATFITLPENVGWIVQGRDKTMARVRPPAAHPGIPFFADLARETGATILAGTLHVLLDDGKVANRCHLFGPDGSLIAQYDKIHMFDVNLPNGETYRESRTFEPGARAVVAETAVGPVGMTICYDVRFPYLYRDLAHAGAQILTVPAAFTRPTGRAHWHVLLRARAIETGCFVIAPAQTGEHDEGRATYGHSLIVAPWGEVLADGGEAVGVVTAEIDMDRVDRARSMVPSLTHDRGYAAPVPVVEVARAAE